jgi:hypothetical protein
MEFGPARDTDASPTAEPALPGEFVTDEMRADCARFLAELRALVRLRRELPEDGSSWMPVDRDG